MLEANRTFLDPEILKKPIYEKSVRKELTRNLSLLIPEILDEITVGVDKFFGMDTEEWKEIGVFQNMKSIISRTTNRVLVGFPLCKVTLVFLMVTKFCDNF